MRMGNGMPDVFISHAHEDKELAVKIADSLEKIGYTAWYYERDTSPGESPPCSNQQCH